MRYQELGLRPLRDSSVLSLLCRFGDDRGQEVLTIRLMRIALMAGVVLTLLGGDGWNSPKD